MGSKRKRTPGSTKSQDAFKRQHASHDNDDDELPGFRAARGYIDPSTGQRGAFPGLEEYGDEFFCGPANDGMDYLRMVRSEARGVPSLLIAKAAPISTTADYDDYEEEFDNDEVGTGAGGGLDVLDRELDAEDYQEDTRGWYEDGTYIATGTASFPQRPPSPNKVALLSWHEVFMSQFRQLRSVLHGSPHSSVSSPSNIQSNTVLSSHPLPHKQEDWVDLIYNTSPTPTYLWKMDQYTVLKGFKIMVDLLKVGTDTPIEQTRWIYGLLVRCSEVMTPEEVYIVRELGKKAIQVQKKLETSNCLSVTKTVSETPVEEEAVEGKASEEMEVGSREPTATKEEEPEEIPSLSEQNDKEFETPEVPPLSDCPVSLGAEDENPVELEIQTQNIQVDGPSNSYSSSEGKAPEPSVVATQRLNKKRKNRKPKSGNYNYVPSPNTLSTLDMIISIVGDFFGQRDLLDERRYHTLGGLWGKTT